MSIQPGRLTVDNREQIVVFLIGARINKWWLLPIVMPVLSKMARMLRELARDPEAGLLGFQSFGMGGTVQYWKSLQHLENYARDREKEHRPAWAQFMKRLFPNASAGVWHETFLVEAGRYEALYVNMPRTGMGRFRELVPATGRLSTSAGRLAPKNSAARAA